MTAAMARLLSSGRLSQDTLKWRNIWSSKERPWTRPATVTRLLSLTRQPADCEGWTPLIVATINGHLDLARYLLEQGADRDKADNYGDTPPPCCLLWSSGDRDAAHELWGRLECEEQPR